MAHQPPHKTKIKKHFKLIKRVFRKAGMVRDAQMAIDYLQAHDQAGALRVTIALLEQQLVERQAQFFALQGREKKKWDRSLLYLSRQFRRLKKKEVDRSMRRQTEKLKSTLSHGLRTAEAWHGLRKKLKSLHYCQQAVRRKPPANLLLQQSDSITEVLGDWHDLLIVSHQLALLTANTTLPPSEIVKLTGIQGETVFRRDSILGRMGSVLQEFASK